MSCASDENSFPQIGSLHEAVSCGNVRAVLSLLTEDPSRANQTDINGCPPLLLLRGNEDADVYNSIVKILIEHKADVNFFHKEKLTALHNAVYYEKVEAVETLLEVGARCDYPNLLRIASMNGNRKLLQLLLADKERVKGCINNGVTTPAYEAARNGHKDCLKMLIRNGGDLSAAAGNETVMDAIFEHVTRPVDFMVDVLDSSIRIKEEKHYVADFSVLAPEHGARQMDVISSLLVAASDEEKTEVLQHPLIELYLILKWARICYFFYLWITGYVVFVLAMSAYVTLLAHQSGGAAAMTAARCILIGSALCLLAHAILQCLLTHRNHFRKYEMWLNLACTSLSLIVAFAGGRAGNEWSIRDMPNWVLHLASVAILLAWTELMLLIGRLPTYGYYALMFSAVLQNVIRVLLTFVCLVVGFALSFSIQFHNYEQFSDPWRALVKTTVMMMGEFEYGDLFTDNPDKPDHLSATSRVIFMMFIILTSIVLMNLMVGLAVSDIQTLQKESHARKLEKQAEFLCQLEKVITSKQLNAKWVPTLVKRIFARSSIKATYELTTSAKFRKSNKLSSRIVESLVAIAKRRRREDAQELRDKA